MTLKLLNQFPLKNKRILLRVAYDITLKKEKGKWTIPDDRRIRETLPTINYLLEQNCSLVLMSWLKRPGGQIDDDLRMDPVAEKLSELLKLPVKKLDDCIGPEVDKAVSRIKPKGIIMLENTRFHIEEEEADPEFAKRLASVGEFVVFDAFGQSHRIHGSTTGILKNHRNSCAAGFLLKEELDVLLKIRKSPMKPFVVVLGGAKISDKVQMMKKIMKKADIILIGGALASTFLKARGFGVGASLVEGTFVDKAKGKWQNPVKVAWDLLDSVVRDKVPPDVIPDEWPNGHKISLYKLQLPLDVITAPKNGGDTFDDNTLKIEKVNGVHNLCSNKEAILDIGPCTIKLFSEIMKKARTIFWNGPMGMFEDFNFSHGTQKISEAIANSNGYSVIGGGDTEGVICKYKMEGKFGHVSTGGGAGLALLGGEKLPVLKYLETKD